MGTKLQKTVNYGSYQVTTDYRDGYQYETKPPEYGGREYAQLLFFPTAEGYVKALYKDGLSDKDPAAYQYVYIYKDHLGNNRLSYTIDFETGKTKILEENNYYPFGLKHGNYNNTKKDVKYKEELAEKKEIKQVVPEAVKFKYLYNGKELQDELDLNVYDYGARVYDPAAPRFWQVDPLAEKYSFQSVYVYADDNPVFFVDINGMGTEEQEWIPKVDNNGNVSYVAEEGDNAETFAKQYGLTETEANQIVPDNIQVGEAVSGEKVKAFTEDHSEILKLDLSNHNDELTDSDIIHQAVFAIRYDFIQVSKLSENGTVPDWSLNLKSYFKDVSNYVDRHAGGMFYGIDTKKTNITLGGQIFKDVMMSFASDTNGLISNHVANARYLENGRTAYDIYYPHANNTNKISRQTLTFYVNSTNDYKFKKYLNP